ncbi:iron-siderophore ABC transporter substrate-binding protein [Nocardiopsis sp. MG754419]|uniref:iron-siderophore ABC transporter substrate-binding protein n=1 Tax=Nocardiopsis sp. MG754419 TaxID=2259865 RepID=UPI001BAB98A2|nr:iron-siderophore ABC transporter substrate-binding protein [Nocardiopsis sp. MG754419]MBR8740771.1 Fe3+-hydroxamate ABC transporter [Nocardiopsis sp. MG754419]
MIRIRRLATIATMALALTATGCGTTGVEEPETDGVAAPPSDECAEDTTTTTTDPVSLTDGVGRRVELDRPAERVAVLEWQQVEDALTLCVTPVAISDTEGYSTWVSAEELPEGVTDVGSREEPDLDTLYAQNPDLVIVEASDPDDEIIARLEQRDVPVVVTLGADPTDPIGNMRDVFSLIGEATGRTERAERVLGEFDDRLTRAREQVADVDLPTTDFLYFDGWLQGGNLTVRPYGQGALFTALGEELGMTSAWTDDINEAYGDGGVDPSYGLAQTDVEGLTAVGEANLFYANDEGVGGYVEELEKNPIWNSLPAVQEDRAHSFPPRIWGAGGPRSTEQAVDAFVDALTRG